MLKCTVDSPCHSSQRGKNSPCALFINYMQQQGGHVTVSVWTHRLYCSLSPANGRQTEVSRFKWKLKACVSSLCPAQGLWVTCRGTGHQSVKFKLSISPQVYSRYFLTLSCKARKRRQSEAWSLHRSQNSVFCFRLLYFKKREVKAQN